MLWARNLEAGTFVGADAAGAPVERLSLQELFIDIAERESREFIAAARQRAVETRAARLAAIELRIGVELGIPIDDEPKSRRGAARAVVLLHVCDTRGLPSYTPLGDDLKPLKFRTVTLAGIFVNSKADCVCQAIRNNGVSRGHAFAYIDSLPLGHPYYIRCVPAKRMTAAERLMPLAAAALGHRN